MAFGPDHPVEELEALPLPLPRIGADFRVKPGELMGQGRVFGAGPCRSDFLSRVPVVEGSVIRLGDIPVLSGRTTPLVAWEEGEGISSVTVCHAGRPLYREGSMALPVPPGAILLNPRQGGCISTGLLASINFPIEHRRLARVLRAMGAGDLSLDLQRPYVLGVLTAATLVFVGARFLHSEDWSDAFYHAMVLLVAASPCAVVVSSPAVMLSAIARAGRHGVLFKGAVHVESLGAVDVIAFDKTGTVTEGRPRVAELWTPPGVDPVRMLGLAATIERRSEHPLGVPIVEEARLRSAALSAEPLVDFHSHTGLGVHGRVGGVWVGIGREGLFSSHDVVLPEIVLEQAARIRGQGQTALIVSAAEADVYGVIAVADQPRPEAADAIRHLKQLGVQRVVILTGDHEKVARGIANRLGADDVRAGLMPDQKVVELRKLVDDGGLVAMVGDGVNDAPALAAARVGIAMGAAGTDVALEVADVVLMGDDLRVLPLAVWISRQACRRVRQNMIFAFSMIALLVLGSFANLPLWLGVLGHEGSTVLVVFNGLRLLRERAPSWN